MARRRKRSQRSIARQNVARQKRRAAETLLRPLFNSLPVFCRIKTRVKQETVCKIVIDDNYEFWLNKRLAVGSGTNKTRYADNGWMKIGDANKLNEFAERMKIEYDCIKV